MKAPSILSCLPGLSNQCILQSYDKSRASSDEENAATLPPPEEVLAADIPSKQLKVDRVTLHGGFTLLKGRVNATEVLGIPNSDLVPGKYEGGFKLWECTTDLVDTLRREIQDGQLSFRGKRVLEVGCGHGLPGIIACIKGAAVVHFQDFNAEVLKCLTIPNVNANLEYARARLAQPNGSLTPTRTTSISPEVHYYAGDWADVDSLLSSAVTEDSESSCTLERDNGEFSFRFSEMNSSSRLSTDESSSETCVSNENDNSSSKSGGRDRRRSGSRACESRRDEGIEGGGYDIILMSETVYSISSFPKLYSLIKKCLRPYYGVVYVAGKKHYFGVGGGTRQFKHMVEEDGTLVAHLVAEFADGSSNVREIWKFFFKQ